MAKSPSTKRKSGREAASLYDHLSWREQQQSSSRRSGVENSAAGGSNANTNGSGSSKNASSSSAKRAKIKADPDAADPDSTSDTRKSKSGSGTMFREEALGKRVLVLFDVDTGHSEMGKEWYEGTVTAMTLEIVGGDIGGIAKSNKRTVGKKGGGRGRGGAVARAKQTAGRDSATDGGQKLKFKAIHHVKFDDGDERWFDLMNWDERGELEWVGDDRPTPRSDTDVGTSTDDDNDDNDETTVGAKRRCAGKGEDEKEVTNKSATKEDDGAGGSSAMAVAALSPHAGKRAPRSSPAKPKAAASSVHVPVVPPESPPHQLINGTKYYMI
mmetsp:Transcript_37940/g.82533  ORF Transcript_37940/g.82533 Transcript_37940/m.82533 type:complete len:327 (+) Transcript_37940:37-1017(+)